VLAYLAGRPPAPVFSQEAVPAGGAASELSPDVFDRLALGSRFERERAELAEPVAAIAARDPLYEWLADPAAAVR
jgi:hypothetical protein